MSGVRVAAVQHDIAWEDRAATTARLAPRIAEAGAAGARLVVLTELFPVGFTMETDRVAEPPDGPSVQFLRDQAAANGVWVCGSVPIAPADGDPRPANQFVLASPGGEIVRYDKIHPFTYGGEAEHYRAGSERTTVDVEGVRLTPFVCYDLRFADEWWAMAHDTDCYVVVANWPAARRHHWRALLVARAIENQAYVVGVNRVGQGGGLDYAGDSMVVDPMGEVLADGGDGGEQVLVADIDPARVADVRRQYPFLADRR